MRHRLEITVIHFRDACAHIPKWLRRMLLALVGLGLLGLVIARSGSALAEVQHISAPSGWLLALAIVAETASLVAYVLMVRQILRHDGLAVRTRPLLRMTLGGIAMSSSLPAGVAASTGYWLRELQREGADRAHAAVVLVRTTVAGVVSLAALLIVGVAVAGASGPLAHFYTAILVTGGLAIVAIALLWSPLIRFLYRRFPSLPSPLGGHEPTGAEGLMAVGTLALVNWILDCLALALALLALHVTVPLDGLLLTYCLAQVVATIPLLPGGAGTVEASLAVGFAAFGHTAGPLVAGVLLYRVISQWGLVPLGWGAVAAAHHHPVSSTVNGNVRRASPNPNRS